jgi:hypothetical protein
MVTSIENEGNGQLLSGYFLSEGLELMKLNAPRGNMLAFWIAAKEKTDRFQANSNTLPHVNISQKPSGRTN